MNSSVLNKFFKAETGNLSANRVKARNCNGFGRIVNNKVNAGNGFNGADISALSSDYAALHLISGQRNNRNRCFRNIIRRAARKNRSQNFSCFLFGFVLVLLLILHNAQRLFVRKLCVKVGKKLGFRLFFGISRNAFQHIKLAFFNLLRF